ncbi:MULTISPECIES: acetyl-coenzyme A synthetase N-terminal domain-containing protein [unclassified Pseudofrankia]|uniref:acetyl-coenzyme A synthetase N-terminal domain-containing protein n=1 Tax=unclassified Pseudofrankia TaxID=2994372 RepID=UPI0008DA3645|nr:MULTISPECIES: acetyl-coenzyme A synthetase N-terminal domain-containing protein [unclassified Pseudofrankia]MDT3444697.1 acetyl-coenzyme A synthetase N-terminal domain-containing protein [Pseudofrankia sp. BMG5.37]OHV66566.1 hypothetical protein BCD48_35775 [Pseudofrankia sp. BMG5.36]
MTQTPDVLWRPRPGTTSELTRFADRLRGRGVDLPDYEALRTWSVENLDEFWLEAWRHFDLLTSTELHRALVEDTMPGAIWFPEVATNYAAAVLRLPGRTDDDTRGTGPLNTWAAVESGTSMVDASLGGLGGEPSAVEQNRSGETGNVATEDLVVALERAGVATEIDVPALREAGRLQERMTGVSSRARVLRTGSGLGAPT